jgi:glycosyltransferase involved in cell wall biosynthesis
VLLLAGRLDQGADRAKSIAYDLNLGDRVKFIGSVKDISGLLNSTDLCVFCSNREGCPNGVLEAMAAGLPVVGTDISGIRQAVGESGFNFLSPKSDYQAFAQRILRLIDSTHLRVALGQQNRKRIETEFSTDKMCRSTVELIFKVARRSKS